MKTYITILSAALVASTVSCSREEAKTEEKEELPVVTVDVVHSKAVPQSREYTANVEAENLNNIAPATPNRIKTIRVDVGDRVQAGQTLVTLDSSNSDQIRINLEQLEREYNRAVQLLEIGGGTQQAVDQLKAQLDAAKSQYANIQENTVLSSPITGVVTARNYDPGDMSGNLPVLTVGQLSPVVKVLVNISENDMADVSVGQPVSINLDAYPGETFSGKVYRVYPTVDPASRTFGVEIRIPNPGERLKPGMFARVEIGFGERENVVVPDRAVVKQTGSGNKYVYVLHGNKVSYNRVELGRRLDNAYELIEGVADGDTVVITGQSRLADGVEVEVQ
ncbi:MAG: efflux RND transporter periplasmic adaptor subunit [Muribaculaceae bacterium]|jgi:RND family efflux transporter MFP subunit|nr:efflux RND transporter periplasmic adaptor subunit [Muribaculaceae bacterium]